MNKITAKPASFSRYYSTRKLRQTNKQVSNKALEPPVKSPVSPRKPTSKKSKPPKYLALPILGLLSFLSACSSTNHQQPKIQTNNNFQKIEIKHKAETKKNNDDNFHWKDDTMQEKNPKPQTLDETDEFGRKFTEELTKALLASELGEDRPKKTLKETLGQSLDKYIKKREEELDSPDNIYSILITTSVINEYLESSKKAEKEKIAYTFADLTDNFRDLGIILKGPDYKIPAKALKSKGFKDLELRDITIVINNAIKRYGAEIHQAIEDSK